MVLLSDQREGHSCIIVIMADTWFTSDFHLGHFNIIRYCNRPFADTREMDEVIVDRLNALVKPNDTLYFLGDFCLGKHDNVAAYRNRLACKSAAMLPRDLVMQGGGVSRKSVLVAPNLSSILTCQVQLQSPRTLGFLGCVLFGIAQGIESISGHSTDGR